MDRTGNSSPFFKVVIIVEPCLGKLNTLTLSILTVPTDSELPAAVLCIGPKLRNKTNIIIIGSTFFT